MEAYTEEIDTSAVRIRENKALSSQISQVTEEIGEDYVRIHQSRALQGQITKSPSETKVKMSYFFAHIGKNFLYLKNA